MKAGRPTPPRGPAPPPRLLTPGLNKSQDSTLGQSLTPEHIRSMIRMSSTQNLYEIMHAADATLYRSTPELVVHRPKTSSISSLTARENIRLEQRLNVGNVGPSRRIERTRAARAITMIPGEEDFRKVIEKLNRLQARGGAQDKRLILEEGKTLSIVAEEEETVHAKVDVKGARTPLTVLIRRLHGRVLTYVSKTVQEPMEQMCDAKFRGDRVMVTDPGLRFKCNVVYLTFRAVESAEFLVSVQFGKQRQVTHSTRRDSKDFDYASDISFASRDRKRASSSKDFLELNMKVSASADRLRFFEKRRSMSEKRRKETLLRYHENIAQKKSQALSMLQKREIKQQECARQLVLLEQKKLAADRARGWVTLVANSQCLSEMLRKFSRRRAELCEQRLQDCQASRMQRAVRKFIWFKKPDLIATTLCLHHVSLYANSLFSFTLPKLQESIMVCMRTSFLRAKVTTQFSHFFGNGKL